MESFMEVQFVVLVSMSLLQALPQSSQEEKRCDTKQAAKVLHCCLSRKESRCKADERSPLILNKRSWISHKRFSKDGKATVITRSCVPLLELCLFASLPKLEFPSSLVFGRCSKIVQFLVYTWYIAWYSSRARNSALHTHLLRTILENAQYGDYSRR